MDERISRYDQSGLQARPACAVIPRGAVSYAAACMSYER